jgi:hypothetical protein
MRKKDKSGQSDNNDEKAVHMEKPDPGLTQTDNPQNDDPH